MYVTHFLHAEFSMPWCAVCQNILLHVLAVEVVRVLRGKIGLIT